MKTEQFKLTIVENDDTSILTDLSISKERGDEIIAMCEEHHNRPDVNTWTREMELGVAKANTIEEVALICFTIGAHAAKSAALRERMEAMKARIDGMSGMPNMGEGNPIVAMAAMAALANALKGKGGKD